MKPFYNVAGLKPRRSVFNNSYYKVFDCDLGQLIPIMCDFFMPGDLVKISAEILVRAQPLIAPIMHRIDLKADYFAVPVRLLWPKPDYKDEDGNSLGYTPDVSSWEEFITGGVKGKLEPAQPRWIPTNKGLYSLWDYFGFPINVDAQGAYPVAWPKRAYNMVYNEYFRAQDFEDPIDLDSELLLKRKWEKDYFTSALPDLYRGVAPALPVSGYASAVWSNNPPNMAPHNHSLSGRTSDSVTSGGTHYHNPTGNNGTLSTNNVGVTWPVDFIDWANSNSIDLSKLGTFDANDMRLVFAITRNLERSMRAGSRLTEHVLAHWGVHNGDSRLNRPEYIGGIRNPVIVSEVLQTSRTEDGESPQGNLAGHGISVADTRVGTYYCKEETIIIGIMSLVPKPVYQQGIQRQWLYETRWDYPTPELVNLGEQEIFNAELCATADATFNRGIFGYQGRYDEHRVKHNMICGTMRSIVPDGLSHWHLGRIFDPAQPPALNDEFLTIEDDKRYSAVQSQPGWLVTYGNRIRRVAPLPIVGTPGLLDHN